MSDEAPDVGPDNGKRPAFAKPIDTGLGAIGTGGGYSGQEYDSAGQEDWRRRQDALAVDPGGKVEGSGAGAGGAPGEDYDDDSATGSAPPPTGR
ncbi:hypothetical protein ACFOKI_05580 [Sphingomonas qilianensis]|uniref:Uncharacterized protein n=1 Tax=Sphingomonas qilianensis TaxID=1736690 RepID=A0ABU9XRL7_9SPHN